MSETSWSSSEKRIAHRVFDAALERELAEIMSECKARAARAKAPADLWDLERHLARARREIDAKYDFRYSTLELVFGRLLREKRIEAEELQGLAEDKRARILGVRDILIEVRKHPS